LFEWARITQVDEQIPVDTQFAVGYRLADGSRLSYNPQVLENKAIPGSTPGAAKIHTHTGIGARRIGMKGIRILAGLAIGAALCLVVGGPSAIALAQTPAAGAPAAGGQDAAKPAYTMAEYNAFTAAQQTKDPAQQIKALDDFVSKYPNSALLNFVYPLYYNAYSQLKNFPKVIEYADKTLALGDKIEPPVRYQAYYARAFAYSNITPPPTDPDMNKKAHQAALDGLKTLNDLKKPDNMTQEQFDAQKKQPAILFNYTAANSATQAKDYQGAIDSYKEVLKVNPDDAITSYRIGQAYMLMTPPQTMDAFWAFARAITAKGANPQQVTQVKTYLRKLVVNYQQAACDNLTDAEMNELLQLASSSPDKPSSYTLPSAADLDAARKDMTIASVITDLKAGGDKGKITWLASCGLEFPDVPGKLIEVTPGTDATQLKVAFVTSDAEFDSKTTPDMDVKVVGQPDAAKLEKDNPVRFTATLLSYDPDPSFMLHWDKAKVNEEDIPKEKEKGKKAPTKRSTKKPGR
jgi:tetratricopeptide (TPR) repeat protein